jgi:hypothetical protein
MYRSEVITIIEAEIKRIQAESSQHFEVIPQKDKDRIEALQIALAFLK